MSRNSKGIISTLVGAFLFGTLPLVTLLGCNGGLSAYSTIGLKSLFSIPILIVLILHDNNRGKFTLPVLLKTLLLAVLTAVLTQSLLFSSYLYIAVGAATSLHFIYPVVVLLAGASIYRQKITWRDFVCFGLMAIGIAALYTPSVSEHTAKGMIFALLSGVAYGFFCLLLEKTEVLESISNFQFLLVLNVVGMIFGSISSAVRRESFFCIAPMGYLGVIINALLVGILAHACYQNGIHVLGSRNATLLGTIEPVVSIMLGVLILHEKLTLRAVIGATAIIAASILLIVLKERKKADEPVAET